MHSEAAAKWDAEANDVEPGDRKVALAPVQYGLQTAAVVAPEVVLADAHGWLTTRYIAFTFFKKRELLINLK
jgi:hypothetical protein